MADENELVPIEGVRRPSRLAAPTVEKLLACGEWSRARKLLLGYLEIAPEDDDRRRQLIHCLMQEKRPALVGDQVQQLRSPRVDELHQVASFLIDRGQWSKATRVLQRSLTLAPSAATYYLLARARARRLPDDQILVLDRAQVVQFLAQAVSLPGCPEEAILWLGELRRREWGEAHPHTEGREAARTQAEVYRAALGRHPAYSEVRARLLSILVELQDWAGAAEALKPLLDRKHCPAQVFWSAYQVEVARNNLPAARAYLDQIPLGDCGLGREKVWGDLLLARGEPAAACAAYSLEVERGDPEARFLGLFSRAAAHLAAGDLPAAIADAGAVTTEWFSSLDTGPFAPPLLQPVDQDPIPYPEGSRCIPTVCRALAEEMQPEVNPELRGRLLYIWGVYRRPAGRHELDPAEESQVRDLFLRAAGLTSHPKMGWEVARCHAEQGRLASAVWPTLSYVQWRYECFPEEESPLLLDQDFWPYRPKLTPTERAAIHQQALDYLRTVQEQDVAEAVVVPFYRNFWQDMLHRGKMYQEILEATGVLLDRLGALADLETERFLSLEQVKAWRGLGQLDTAMALCQEHLTADPADRGMRRELDALRAESTAGADAASALQLQAKGRRAGQERPVRRERPEKVTAATPPAVRLLPAASGEGAVRSAFFSPREQEVYGLLVAIFPGRLIIPNAPLQAVLDYDRMKELLPDRQDFEYYLKAMADFCVVTIPEGQPIVALEVDSSYHDAPEQRKRDQRKEHILAVGGLPLVRLRPGPAADREELRQELRAQLQELGVLGTL